MSEDLVYHPHPDLTDEENAEVENYIDEKTQRERDRAEAMRRLPEKLNNFTSTAQDWMVENYFKPAGIDQEDVHFPTFVRDKPLKLNQSQFGVGEGMSKGVYVDLGAIKTRIDDPDIVDYTAARTLLEEIYHYTGAKNISAVVKQGDGQKDVTVDVVNTGFGFVTKGEFVNTMEEGMAQLFVEKASTFLKEQFPVGHQKIAALREPENEGETLIGLRNGVPSWQKDYEGPTELAREVVDHGVRGDVGLVESARIRGEHLGMAHKLKTTYGEDVYKRIMTVPHGQASDLAEELTNKR